MSDSDPGVIPWLERFQQVLPALPGGSNPGLNRRRAQALARFKALGWPGRKTETWKYGRPLRLEKEDFRTDPAHWHAAPVPQVPPLAGACARLVFVDGHWRPDLGHTEGLPDGVGLEGLAAVLHRGETPGPHFAVTDMDEGNLFVALNAALVEDGYVLRVPAGVTLPGPVQVVHLEHAADDRPRARHWRGVVLLAEGAEATVVEHIATDVAAAAPTFLNAVTEVHLAAGARLRLDRLCEGAPGAVDSAVPEGVRVLAIRGHVAETAALSGFTLTTGGAWVRHDARLVLDGPGADVRLDGVTLGRGDRHVDTTLLMDHATVGATSRQTLKSVLDDRARGVYQGTVMVRPGAQQTESHQLNRALLLSDQAEADGKPSLEIHADDVKCSHGNTVGQIDREALFYLRARGLDLATAQAIMVSAFVHDLLDLVPHAATRDLFAARATAWLGDRVPAPVTLEGDAA